MATTDYMVLLDSDVEHVKISEESSGYRRLVTVVNWNSHDERQLGRCNIRVGPRPNMSHALFEVHGELGWHALFMLPVSDWWSTVPGHNRVIDDRSKHTQSTNKVILQLVELADAFATHADI